MAMMNASPQQIAAAAAAGVELLSDKDLKVPLGIAIGGQLSVLHSMLNAVASGELVLVNPPEQQQAAGKEDGDGKPNLKEVAGGKQGEDPPK
jgi:hypothetical protein